MRATLALVVAAALALPVPAGAMHNGEQPPEGCRWIRGTETPEDHGDDVYVCREDTWIRSAGTRLGNLVPFGQGSTPTWGTSPPTTSTSDGGGAYHFTNAVLNTRPVSDPHDGDGSFVSTGAFVGVVDNLAVDLYARVGPAHSEELGIQLEVDGEVMFEAAVDGIANVPAGDLRRFRLAFTDLHEELDAWGKSNGNASEHAFRLSLYGLWVVNDPMVFVYDATDAPAGVVVNHDPAALSSYTKIDLTASS